MNKLATTIGVSLISLFAAASAQALGDYDQSIAALGPIVKVGPKAGPNLVKGGNRWVATAYDDASTTHKQLQFGGQFSTAVYCFSFENNVGTHDRYTYYSETFDTLEGRATQEGDHVVMHGDFGIDIAGTTFNNVGHEAIVWDLVTQSYKDQGFGDYTSWFETDHPGYGKTLAFANIRMVRSGYCKAVEKDDAIGAEFLVPRELEPLVPFERMIDQR